jgi:two-component system response regulator AtoC
MELEARPDVKSMQTAKAQDSNGNGFVEGASPSMRSLEAVIREVAQSAAPVLILGERGVGKKATALRIHELSRRGGQPFRSLACGSVETGQFEKRQIWLSEAGTVFLEEVSELNADGQTWLLRALTEGNDAEAKDTARLICGSMQDLESEVRAGKMREDVYYRISGVCLRLPPLRQRREDISLLTEHFLKKYAHEFQRPVPQLSDETRRLFQEYSWPGNVAELENAAKAIVALGDERVAMGGLRAMLQRSDAGENGGRVSLKQVSRAASREAEKEIILRALTRTRWNRRRAAEDLQISYKALLYKLKQMGCSECGAS